MPRKLRCWNGRFCWGRVSTDPRWKDIPSNHSPHGNVCAYSRADARRVIAEYTGAVPSDNEIKEYWSDCWGNSMDGIEPERGFWVEFTDGAKPERLV